MKRSSLCGTWICAILLLLLPADLRAASTITVTDVEGTPVEGATVCIGTAVQLNSFGQGTTDHLGQALVSAVLPTPPATVIITASKGALRGQVERQLSAAVAPADLFATVQISDAPGVAGCPGSDEEPSFGDLVPGMEVNGADLLAGQVFDIQVFVQRQRERRPTPLPGPVTIYLESSDPRLVPLPRSVAFRRGEVRKHLKAEVSRDVDRATTVTLRARLDGKTPAEVRLRLRPRDDKGSRQRP